MAKYREDRWDLKSACECLIRNGGKANPYERKMSHTRPGLTLLGAMDYLSGEHRFIRVAGDEPTKKRKEKVEKTEPKVVVMYKRKQKLED